MHNIKVSDATMGADMVTAWEFPEMLPEIINEGMYLPKHLMWMRQDYTKRMPNQVSTSKEEKLMLSYKADSVV